MLGSSSMKREKVSILSHFKYRNKMDARMEGLTHTHTFFLLFENIKAENHRREGGRKVRGSLGHNVLLEDS